MRKLLSSLFPPAPPAPAPAPAPKPSATELEWLGWTGEYEGVTLSWVPGTAH